MAILYLQTLNGVTLSLEKAHNLSSKMREMYKDKMFRETGRSPKKINDILLESGNGMERLMNTSFCKSDESIIAECSHRGVYPLVATASFEKSIIQNRIALLSVIEPFSLRGTKVFLDIGLPYGNDIDSSCEGKRVDIVFGFSYDGARALSHYARISNPDERLDIRSIVDSFAKENKNSEIIVSTNKRVINSNSTKAEILVGDFVKFLPLSLSTDLESQITYLNGKVEKLKAGVSQKDLERYGEDVIKENGGMNKILQKLKNRSIGITATVLNNRGNRLTLSIYDANPELYNILYDTAPAKRINRTTSKENVEQQSNLLPDLKQMVVTVTIDVFSGKNINAILKHEGKEYPVLIQGVSKPQQKKLKKGSQVKVRIIDNTKKFIAKLSY